VGALQQVAHLLVINYVIATKKHKEQLNNCRFNINYFARFEKQLLYFQSQRSYNQKKMEFIIRKHIYTNTMFFHFENTEGLL